MNPRNIAQYTYSPALLNRLSIFRTLSGVWAPSLVFEPLSWGCFDHLEMTSRLGLGFAESASTSPNQACFRKSKHQAEAGWGGYRHVGLLKGPHSINLA